MKFYLLILMVGFYAAPTESMACVAVFTPKLSSIDMSQTSPAELVHHIEMSHPALALNPSNVASQDIWSAFMIELAQSGHLQKLLSQASEREGYVVMAAVQSLDLHIAMQVDDRLGLKQFSAPALKAYFEFWKALEHAFDRVIPAEQFAKILLYKIDPNSGQSRESLHLSKEEMKVLESLNFGS